VPERIHINAIIELLEGQSGRVGVQRDFAAEIKRGVLQFNLLKSDRELVETVVSDFPFVYNGVELLLEDAKSFEEKAKFNSLLLNCAVDYDKICDKLILRGRKPGDKINLKGRNCTKTFKNLFNEEGLGLAARDTLVVAADSVGVLWLQGFGIDQRVAVDDTTENVLCFKLSQ
jgi:tRNA(Ile)-lysidine synthase